VYEPASSGPLADYVGRGQNCPRKFLASADVLLLDEPNSRALDNANTPEEYASAMSIRSEAPAAARRRVTVQYFALLREQAGRATESLETTARTPRELYAELAGRYPFTLDPAVLRVAINSEFGEWGAPLADGDAIVFIPPVAGG
jgi:molybdopterin-guanine dinucleotide biosynthesis protein A